MRTPKLSELNLPEGLTPDTVAKRLRGALSSVPGLEMHNAQDGRLSFDGMSARVTILSSERLHVSFEPLNPPSPRQALEATHGLPAAVRFGVAGGKTIVLADMRMHGTAQVADDFRRVVEGLQLAADASHAVKSPTDPLEADLVERVLEETRFGEETIVKREAGWELRPRLQGRPIPVQATIEGDALRVYCRLLADVAGACDLDAVADQALRFNARLRQCRLASTGERIVAEARLHAGRIDPQCLGAAARAVAVAAEHCRVALEILAGQPQVAQHYRAVCSPS